MGPPSFLSLPFDNLSKYPSGIEKGLLFSMKSKRIHPFPTRLYLFGQHEDYGLTMGADAGLGRIIMCGVLKRNDVCSVAPKVVHKFHENSIQNLV